MPFCLHRFGGRNVGDILLAWYVSCWQIEKGKSQGSDFKSSARITEGHSSP